MIMRKATNRNIQRLATCAVRNRFTSQMCTECDQVWTQNLQCLPTFGVFFCYCQNKTYLVIIYFFRIAPLYHIRCVILKRGLFFMLWALKHLENISLPQVPPRSRQRPSHSPRSRHNGFEENSSHPRSPEPLCSQFPLPALATFDFCPCVSLQEAM